MYKVSNGIASPSMSEIFGYKNGTVDNVSSNTRLACKFYNPVKPESTNYGLETLRNLAPIIIIIIIYCQKQVVTKYKLKNTC